MKVKKNENNKTLAQYSTKFKTIEFWVIDLKCEKKNWIQIQKVDLFGMANLRYYIHKVEEKEFKVDYKIVEQYFLMAIVTTCFLQIY